MAVAQLVERSLPTPEPDIGKLLYGTFVYYHLFWKDKNKEKEAGNGPYLKKTCRSTTNIQSNLINLVPVKWFAGQVWLHFIEYDIERFVMNCVPFESA